MSLSIKLVFFVSAFALFAIISSVQANAMDMKIASDIVGKSIKDAASIPGEVRIELLKGKSTIEQLNDGSLEVTKLDFDRDTGVFMAYVSANQNLPFTVAGRFYEVTKVPVLSRKLNKNETIQLADITYLEVESLKLKNGYIMDEQQLVGKSASRPIQKGRPIVESQLTTQKVVERSKQITMIYRNNILSIKDLGIALQDGSVGDVIKLKNNNSGRIVYAKVIDANTAEVHSGNSEVASNNISN